jgi:hypothetical protein
MTSHVPSCQKCSSLASSVRRCCNPPSSNQHCCREAVYHRQSPHLWWIRSVMVPWRSASCGRRNGLWMRVQSILQLDGCGRGYCSVFIRMCHRLNCEISTIYCFRGTGAGRYPTFVNLPWVQLVGCGCSLFMIKACLQLVSMKECNMVNSIQLVAQFD